MASKKILLFDIDRTLLDTDSTSVLRNKALLAALGPSVDTQKIETAKNEYRATLKNEREYIPEDFLRHLSKKIKFENHESLLNIYYGEEFKYIYEDAVYPEVKIVLDKLKGKYRLGVFSEGTKKFQSHKFRSMDLNEYFDDDLIFIRDAKDTKEIIDEIPKGAIIVDDKERICDFLFANGVQCIWLNKKDDRISKNYKTTHSLLELPSLLTSC
jgi:FMN phosphatase YigB (HAD superfamily)